MNRLNELRSFMNEKGIICSIVTNPDHQFYLTGFRALIYSRPIYLIVEETKTKLIVPALEEVHANEAAKVDDIIVYYEHPEMERKGTNPVQKLREAISGCAPGNRLGIDMATAPAKLVGFLQEAGYEIVDIGRKIAEMRFIKDEEEIKLIEEAGRLVTLAVSESLKVCKVGVTELEIDAAGNYALFKETAKQYPNATLDLNVMSPSGVQRTVMPHVFSTTRKLEYGDIVIHSRQVGLFGYRAELERTVIIGKPTEEQKKAFEAAKIAQEAAIEFIRPGVTAAEVDQVAREVLRKEGFGEYSIHRTGHGIGVSAHEEPYIRFDNHLVLKEGMVFCIEPGIYIPGVGGFRHSDTVVLTKNGSRVITQYKNDLESLTFS